MNSGYPVFIITFGIASLWFGWRNQSPEHGRQIYHVIDWIVSIQFLAGIILATLMKFGVIK